LIRQRTSLMLKIELKTLLASTAIVAVLAVSGPAQADNVETRSSVQIDWGVLGDEPHYSSEYSNVRPLTSLPGYKNPLSRARIHSPTPVPPATATAQIPTAPLAAEATPHVMMEP